VIGHFILSDGADDPGRDGDSHGEDHAENREFERQRQALGDNRGHGNALFNRPRRSEVPLHGVPEPRPVLDVERLREPELGPNLSDQLLVLERAQHHSDWTTG